ncbi:MULTISPECIES: hypothetical protein [Vibrio]|uniref:Lipoprotein n=1 Tax=Vibrio jasicida TaxID=766224 RepID=A0AAU9QTN6_9VIBR|nr:MULTISPECIES: hypothetical protein [Vibrio]MCZ2798988.1 hypothetical protein [Vibrio alginolyticus]PAW02404.1 hypothetical protein CKJ79_17220 [Vibrio coralliilyticus]CAH1588779.1 conserved hypothetical protein [Vibrio jasicida]CAH1599762.1 conserved hypothetical protein [Vibrio jasicida]
MFFKYPRSLILCLLPIVVLVSGCKTELEKGLDEYKVATSNYLEEQSSESRLAVIESGTNLNTVYSNEANRLLSLMFRGSELKSIRSSTEVVNVKLIESVPSSKDWDLLKFLTSNNPYISYSDFSFRRFSDEVFAKVAQQLVLDEEWDALLILGAPYRTYSHDSLTYLVKNYHGKDPYLLTLKGIGLQELGNYHAAFNVFQSAALLDRKYSMWPVAMARHFGCEDLESIWIEFVSDPSRINQYTRFFSGGTYPSFGSTLTKDQIFQYRSDIKGGKLAPIFKGCLPRGNG